MVALIVKGVVGSTEPMPGLVFGLWVSPVGLSLVPVPGYPADRTSASPTARLRRYGENNSDCQGLPSSHCSGHVNFRGVSTVLGSASPTTTDPRGLSASL